LVVFGSGSLAPVIVFALLAHLAAAGSIARDKRLDAAI
jgi:hypothetical protein